MTLDEELRRERKLILTKVEAGEDYRDELSVLRLMTWTAAQERDEARKLART